MLPVSNTSIYIYHLTRCPVIQLHGLNSLTSSIEAISAPPSKSSMTLMAVYCM